MGIDATQIGAYEALRVLVATYPDEDTRGCSRKPTRTNAGIFQCFPCHLQEQSLLGIQAQSFPWGDSKKFGIKFFDPIEERSSLRIDAPWFRKIGIIVRVQIPAVDWHASDRVVLI